MHTETNASPNPGTSRPASRRFALGGFFSAVGLAFLLVVLFGNQKTRSIPGDPGPWMLPVALGLLLLIGGIMLGIVPSRAESTTKDRSSTRQRFLKQFALLAGVILYTIALPWLGFLAATPAFVFLMLWRTKVSWWKALIAAVVLTAVGQLVFVVGFKTPLPSGFWS